MIIRFNIAQLERERCEALSSMLEELQLKNKAELDVSTIEFPKKFLVKLDGDVEMIISWDDEKKVYAGVVKPEPEPEPKPELSSEDVRKLALDLSARLSLVEDGEQRLKLWIEFYTIVFGELVKGSG